jgi:PHD/YefM family antitoxin component YafN of YafNO toxin-antitoxin module
MATISAIPVIDPDVKFVGVSKLRDLNATKLRDNAQTTYVFQDNDQPLAVLLSYDRYLTMQSQLEGIVGLLEMLTNEEEQNGVVAGLRDSAAGRVKSFAQIKAALRGSNDG